MAILCLGDTARAEFEDIDDILIELDDAEGEDRIDLIKRLCKVDDDETAPVLVSVLLEPKKEDTPEIQELVFKSLLRYKNEEIVPDLEMVLQGEDPQPKAYAVRLLARIHGPKAIKVASELLQAESLIRTEAIKALGDCRSPEAGKILKKFLRSPSATEDDHIFIRMSLVKLGDGEELQHLLRSYQSIISEALHLEILAVYIDTPAAKIRNRNRTRFLWQLEKEIRIYFTELPDSMIPILIKAVEKGNEDEGTQLVFELLPRLISPERCKTFEPMLRSRFIGLRQLALHYFFNYNKPELKVAALASLRRHLVSIDWLDRRMAMMYSSHFREEERWKILNDGIKDSVVWVRIEAVRELGRWRTDKALELIHQVQAETKEFQLQFTCKVVLAGLSEDYHGLR